MRTFAQKQNQPSKHASPSLARSNTAIPEQTTPKELKVELASSTLSSFAHDFSLIPVHSKSPVTIQAKLMVNTPGDIYEREAERVAEQVIATSAHSLASGAPLRIQRYARQVTGELDTAPPSVDRVLATPGRPLEPALRQDMEQRFGYDFSRVRVHTGAVAEQSAQEVSANAYTAGHSIVFGAGLFAPGTYEGQRLLAHELTHVVQQSGSDGIRMEQSNEKRNQSTTILQGFWIQRSPDPYATYTIEELRKKAVTDSSAAEALRGRFRAMSNVQLERFARNDPMAQSIYAQRSIAPRAAERQGGFSAPAIQDALEQDIVQERARLEKTGIRRQSPSAAQPHVQPEGGTIASARTDIPGFEGRSFLGRSPLAGGQVNPDSWFAPPTDPKKLRHTHGHAEQHIADQMEATLRKIPREKLAGRRVWILVEQAPCSTCAQGVADPAVKAGVLKRLSNAFPELIFEVRSLDSSALLRPKVMPGVNPPAKTAMPKPTSPMDAHQGSMMPKPTSPMDAHQGSMMPKPSRLLPGGGPARFSRGLTRFSRWSRRGGGAETQALVDALFERLHWGAQNQKFFLDEEKRLQPEIEAQVRGQSQTVLALQGRGDIAYANITWLRETVRGGGANLSLNKVEVTNWYKEGTDSEHKGISLEAFGQHAAGKSGVLATYSEVVRLHPDLVTEIADHFETRLQAIESEIANTPSPVPTTSLEKEYRVLSGCLAKLLSDENIPSLGWLRGDCTDLMRPPRK